MLSCCSSAWLLWACMQSGACWLRASCGGIARTAAGKLPGPKRPLPWVLQVHPLPFPHATSASWQPLQQAGGEAQERCRSEAHWACPPPPAKHCLCPQLPRPSTSFISFYETVKVDAALTYLIAFLVALATVKLWHLLQLNPRLYLISQTLRKAWEEVLGFLLTLLVLLVGYTIAVRGAAGARAEGSTGLPPSPPLHFCSLGDP